MRKIIINEKKYVSDILTNKEKPDIGFYPFLVLLIKYYCSLYNDLETVRENVDVQMRNIFKEEYIKEKWYVYICSLFKDNNTKISERKYITVYAWDMIQVFKGETDRERKLLFSAYVLAHYMNCNGWINTKTSREISEWFELSNVVCNNADKFKIIGELKGKKLISLSKQCHNLNVKVELLEDYTGESPVFKIVDMENLGNLLAATYKDGYKQLEICGKLFRIKSNSQIVCPACAKEN